MSAGIEEVGVTVLRKEACHLGEDATYDRATDTAWCFDIFGKTLFANRFATGRTEEHTLPVMASQLSLVDAERQLPAADTHLFLRDVASGRPNLVAPMGVDDAATRSNDGRTHSSGALWIGTMGARQKAVRAPSTGSGGELRRILANVTIPNAICFSPDGGTDCFADTFEGRLMRVPVDPSCSIFQ